MNRRIFLRLLAWLPFVPSIALAASNPVAIPLTATEIRNRCKQAEALHAPGFARAQQLMLEPLIDATRAIAKRHRIALNTSE